MSFLKPNKKTPPSKDNPCICRCNSVVKSVIESSIKNGSNNVNEIYDNTSAGLGPCGGSCRPKLKAMLEHYQQTGEFLTIEQLKKLFPN